MNAQNSVQGNAPQVRVASTKPGQQQALDMKHVKQTSGRPSIQDLVSDPFANIRQPKRGSQQNKHMQQCSTDVWLSPDQPHSEGSLEFPSKCFSLMAVSIAIALLEVPKRKWRQPCGKLSALHSSDLFCVGARASLVEIG